MFLWLFLLCVELFRYGFHLIRGLEALGRVGLLRAYDRSNFALTSAVRKVEGVLLFTFVFSEEKYRELVAVQLSRRKKSQTFIFVTLVLHLCRFERFRYAKKRKFSFVFIFWKGLLATVPGAERPADQEFLRQLPGGPPLVQSQHRSANISANSATSMSGDKVAKNVSCVVFVGGCTHAEISALRLLAQRDATREFVVVTTRVTDTKGFLGSILDACIPTPLVMDEPKQ